MSNLEYNHDPKVGGVKLDSGKRHWHLLPEFLLEGVVDVLMLGAKKYDAFNWAKGMPYSRVYNSARRHLTSWFWRKEDYDPESKLHHLDHAIANLLFLRYYTIRYPEQDDRVDLLPLAATPPAAASSDVSAATSIEAILRDLVQKRDLDGARTYDPRTSLDKPGRPSKAEAWQRLDALAPGTVLFQSPVTVTAVEPDEDDIPF